MIRRLTFCINYFLVWSTCMLSFFHWKDQQQQKKKKKKKKKTMRLYYDHHQEIQNWCLSISVSVCLPFIYVISCLITLIYCFLHVYLFSGLITYSVYGSVNKDVLINLPKSWFIPCFHFLLPMSEVCSFFPVVILDCWYRAHWYRAVPYTARNDWKRNEFSFVKIVCAIKSDQTVRLVNYAC